MNDPETEVMILEQIDMCQAQKLRELCGYEYQVRKLRAELTELERERSLTIASVLGVSAAELYGRASNDRAE
jgi:hypothetical protein